MIKLTELLKKSNKSLENSDNLYLAILTGSARGDQPTPGSPSYALDGGGGRSLVNSSSPISVSNLESRRA